jgi:hypothetical protein
VGLLLYNEDGALVLIQIFVNWLPDYTVSHLTWVCLHSERREHGTDDEI